MKFLLNVLLVLSYYFSLSYSRSSRASQKPDVIPVVSDDIFLSPNLTSNGQKHYNVNVFHLLDRSGSVPVNHYLSYLAFAQNITQQLFNTFGNDLTVSLLGFGCKLDQTIDKTTTFLTKSSEIEEINQAFETAKQPIYYPTFTRTCLHHVLKHLEITPASQQKDEMIDEVNVILVFTDGESGDFETGQIANSEILNDELVDVFAIGVSKKPWDKIVNYLVKDEDNVFAVGDADGLTKVLSRSKDFVERKMIGVDLTTAVTLVEDDDALSEINGTKICTGTQLGVQISFQSFNLTEYNLENKVVLCEFESDKTYVNSYQLSAAEELAPGSYFCGFDAESVKEAIEDVRLRLYFVDEQTYETLKEDVVNDQQYARYAVLTQGLFFGSADFVINWKTCVHAQLVLGDSQSNCLQTESWIKVSGPSVENYAKFYSELSILVISEKAESSCNFNPIEDSYFCKVENSALLDFFQADSTASEDGLDLSMELTVIARNNTDENSILLLDGFEVDYLVEECASVDVTSSPFCLGENIIINFSGDSVATLLSLKEAYGQYVSFFCEIEGNLFLANFTGDVITCELPYDLAQVGQQEVLLVAKNEDIILDIAVAQIDTSSISCLNFVAVADDKVISLPFDSVTTVTGCYGDTLSFEVNYSSNLVESSDLKCVIDVSYHKDATNDLIRSTTIVDMSSNGQQNGLLTCAFPSEINAQIIGTTSDFVVTIVAGDIPLGSRSLILSRDVSKSCFSSQTLGDGDFCIGESTYIKVSGNSAKNVLASTISSDIQCILAGTNVVSSVIVDQDAIYCELSISVSAITSITLVLAEPDVKIAVSVEPYNVESCIQVTNNMLSCDEPQDDFVLTYSGTTVAYYLPQLDVDFTCRLIIANSTSISANVNGIIDVIELEKNTVGDKLECILALEEFEQISEDFQVKYQVAFSELAIFMNHTQQLVAHTQINPQVFSHPECATKATNDDIGFQPVVSSLSTGFSLLSCGLLIVFAHKYKQKQALLKKENNKSFNVAEYEDLVEVIVQKEHKRILSEAKFKQGDLVVLDNSLGVVVKARVVCDKVVYDLKLRSDKIEQRSENDFKLYTLEVGEVVEIMDEEDRSIWHEVTVVRFNKSKRSCDVKMDSTRINDVPITCVRKLPSKVKQEAIHSASFKVPSKLEDSHHFAVGEAVLAFVGKEEQGGKFYTDNCAAVSESEMNAAVDASKPQPHNDKNLKVWMPAKIVKLNSDNISYEVEFPTLSRPNEKYVFIQNLKKLDTTFSLTGKDKAKSQTLDNSLLKDSLLQAHEYAENKNVSSFKWLSVDDMIYEITLRIPDGLGVCLGLTSRKEVIIAKFVELKNGNKGPAELSGKIHIKDKLRSVNGVDVAGNDDMNLARISEQIRNSRRESGEVSFVLQKRKAKVEFEVKDQKV